MANTEAFIDFHEEENIEDDILESGNLAYFLLRYFIVIVYLTIINEHGSI